MAELTISEASRVLGLSAATIKRRLSSGDLTGRKEPRPQGTRWLVEVDTAQPPLTDSSLEGSRTDAAPLTLLTALQDQITMLKDRVKAQEREISELHILLQTAQTSLTAPQHHPWWKLWQIR